MINEENCFSRSLNVSSISFFSLLFKASLTTFVSSRRFIFEKQSPYEFTKDFEHKHNSDADD